MSDPDPTTREEAVALAMDWAAGRRSTWNTYAELGLHAEPDQRARCWAACAEADAAEVVKWTAIAQVLPSAGEVTEPKWPAREGV